MKNFFRRLSEFISIVIIGFVFIATITIITMNIFGNYAENFTVFGLRGYEAGGALAVLVASVLYIILVVNYKDKIKVPKWFK